HVKASRQREDEFPSERACDHCSRVARDRCRRKSWDFAERNFRGDVNLVGEASEPGAEHDRSLRLVAAERIANRVGSRLRVARTKGHHAEPSATNAAMSARARTINCS